MAQAVCRARDSNPYAIKYQDTGIGWQRAKRLRKKGHITVKVLAGKELHEFGGLQAVGIHHPTLASLCRNQLHPARFKELAMSYWWARESFFDTGGISLKRPYETMIGMKSDMVGAATVLAVVGAMPDISPGVRVTALLGCAENALSSTAQRPW